MRKTWAWKTAQHTAARQPRKDRKNKRTTSACHNAMMMMFTINMVMYDDDDNDDDDDDHREDISRCGHCRGAAELHNRGAAAEPPSSDELRSDAGHIVEGPGKHSAAACTSAAQRCVRTQAASPRDQAGAFTSAAQRCFQMQAASP